ncbi:MAG: hypothetical protein IPL61_17885 [Myxococcales bacterium]|nr:hypothetical protein [Myxococcales bacterium]
MTKLSALAVCLAVLACGGRRAPRAEEIAPAPAPTPVEPTPDLPAADPPVVAALPPVPPAPPPPAADVFPADCSVTPPSQAMRDVLWGTTSDKKPELLDGVRPEKFGQHYYVSDEGHADRFRSYIDGIGGGYVGIGSDQAYLYIGWARPQFAWTVDYDDAVVGMHELQQAFIAASATPDEYKAMWQRDHTDAAKAIIAQLAPEGRERKRLLHVLGQGQPRMRRRIRVLTNNLAGVPTYLSDQATYDFVRNLIKNGCVRPLLVDLLADKGMAGIGRAMTEVGLPVRTVYLSNAEEYWSYTDQFRANIRGLPRDDKSVALHTQSSNANQDYRYTAQPLGTFVAWLDEGWARSVNMMMGRGPVKGPGDYPSKVFTTTPDEARAAREAKRAPKKKRTSTP